MLWLWDLLMRKLLVAQVRDFRNDVILAEACRSDVETYCKDTPAGELRHPVWKTHFYRPCQCIVAHHRGI